MTCPRLPGYATITANPFLNLWPLRYLKKSVPGKSLRTSCTRMNNASASGTSAPRLRNTLLLVPRKPIPRLSGAGEEDAALLGHMMLAAGRIARTLHLDESGFPPGHQQRPGRRRGGTPSAHAPAGRPQAGMASRLGRSGISAAGGREGMCHSCPFPGMVPPCLLVRRGVCL